MAKKFILQNLPKCEDCAIRNSSLFGEIDTDHLDNVRSLRSSQITFNAGDYVYHEGDIPTQAYTLQKGWVNLFKNFQDGRRQILYFSLPGDFLSYRSSNEPLDHSAIALTDITLCAFPLDRFNKLLLELPELSMAINSLTEISTERCYSALASTASGNAEVKAAYLLLNLYLREIIFQKSKSGVIHLPITQVDIADALGLTSVHVSRVLKSLQDKGLIIYKNRNLNVPDEEKLAEAANVNLEELKKLLFVG